MSLNDLEMTGRELSAWDAAQEVAVRKEAEQAANDFLAALRAFVRATPTPYDKEQDFFDHIIEISEDYLHLGGADAHTFWARVHGEAQQ